MSIAVFGSTGFIGSELVRQGCIPVETSREDRAKLPSPTNKMIYCRSTIHNYNPLDNNPYVDIDTNCSHLMSVLQANRLKYGSDFEMAYVSTWFVYGNTQCPASEDSRCDPNGFYSITKWAGEKLLKSYCETFGIKWKVVRLSNVLGIGDGKVSKRRNALQYMIKTLCEGKEIELYKADTYRDYLHVSDAASGILAAVNKGNTNQIYNVGSGRGTMISRMVEYAYDLCNRGEIKLVESPEFHKKVQVDSMWLNVNKILEDTGWSYSIKVENIVEDLVNHYLKVEE